MCLWTRRPDMLQIDSRTGFTRCTLRAVVIPGGVLRWAIVVVVLITAGSASGQPFVATQNWSTPVGVNSAGDSAIIDTDLDNTAETYLLPMSLRGHTSDCGLLASPNRQVLYIRAFGTALTGS